MCCFRFCRCGWNRCNCGCGCGCNNSGCGCSCGGSNSGCGGHDICAGARRQAYREGFRNGYWEGFNDATWGNPGCGGPTPRTAGGPGPAIAESSCGCNN